MSDESVSTAKILVVGANQRSASLTLRDRLFVEETAVPGFLERLRRAGVAQALVMSTCDRVEVQAVHADRDAAVGHVVTTMAAHAGLPADDLNGALYVLSGIDAVRHIFTVTASLDSLVIGEPYVLGQVKASHRAARAAGMTGPDLEAVLQAAYVAAKRVRTETAIGERPVSAAAAAVELARGVHGDLARCAGLLIGAGEMGALVAEAMLSAGLGTLVVVHPRPARAEAIARTLDCHVAPYEDLAEALADADITVAALGSRRILVAADLVKATLKRRRSRPILVVDTSVPGDVDITAARIDGAFLYNVDDLEAVAMRGRQSRANEAGAAATIVAEEVAGFLRGRAERAAVSSLSALRRHFENAREAAIADAGGDADKATRLLINRLLHGPSQALRAIAARGADGQKELRDMDRALDRLFGHGGGPSEDER
ncbi:MAG: glutamyl-tRNA reductase [Rhodospirillales bacterium]